MARPYARRVVDDELDELSTGLTAISLAGAKGVGKTATALQRARTVLELEKADQRTLLEVDPGRLTDSPAPVLVDEWQRYPPVWDTVRRDVDRRSQPGRYLLTGSAEPASAPTHSGAGRIVTVRMRPLSLAERDLAPITVSLGELMSGRRPAISGEVDLGLQDYAREIVRSGFPGLRGLPGRAVGAALDGYLDLVVQRDFPEQGHLVRRPSVLRGWLAAYAAATATPASYTAILDAATPGEDEKPAKSTTIAYRDVLTRLWLLDPVPAWSPSQSALSRLASAPKHHLVDPALAARLVGADEDFLLSGQPLSGRVGALRSDGTLVGALFESLVTQSVRTYAQHCEASVGHLRTRNGDHEVDLIVQGFGRKVVAIEVKLSGTVEDRDVRHLRWLADRLGEDLLDAVVVTAGRHAYRRRDGIAVVPAAMLGP